MLAEVVERRLQQEAPEETILRPKDGPQCEILGWNTERSVVVVRSGWYVFEHGDNDFELVIEKGSNFKEHEL